MIKTSKKLMAIVGISVILIISIVLFIVLNNKDDVKSITITDNIVFLGDSITESFDFEKYFPEYNIINSGVWSDRTDNASRRLKSDVLDYNPKKVFILLGINDVGYDRTNDDITNRIKSIILKIQDTCPQSEIYLLSVYPLNISDFETWYTPMEYDINVIVDDLNVMLYKLARELKVEYIDVSKYLKNTNNELKKEYTIEGIHLTDAAYAKISEVLVEYLE